METVDTGLSLFDGFIVSVIMIIGPVLVFEVIRRMKFKKEGFGRILKYAWQIIFPAAPGMMILTGNESIFVKAMQVLGLVLCASGYVLIAFLDFKKAEREGKGGPIIFQMIKIVNKIKTGRIKNRDGVVIAGVNGNVTYNAERRQENDCLMTSPENKH